MAGEDRYRLAAVRELRTRDEKSRKGELANAVGDARETLAKLEATRARTQTAKAAWLGARASRDQLLDAGATSQQLAHADHFIARRRHELDRAVAEELRCEAAHAERQGNVDAAQLVLARSRAEREVIERHFERWRSERRKLADRRED
jgi:hypothetical protein